MAKAIHPQPQEATSLAVPLLHTIVFGIHKGGAWKTALAVAVAERLAFAGCRVLMVTTDDQLDARFRLGIRGAAPEVARVARGPGSITVIGAAGTKAIDLLYRARPKDLGAFDVAVVDTPPTSKGGCLPGVLWVAPVDSADAARSLVNQMASTPANTNPVLVGPDRGDSEAWQQLVTAIEQAAGRDVAFYPHPLPRVPAIKAAHDEGRSVWTVPRQGGTRTFLDCMDTLAGLMWNELHPNVPMPKMPSAPTVYVPGWDGE